MIDTEYSLVLIISCIIFVLIPICYPLVTNADKNRQNRLVIKEKSSNLTLRGKKFPTSTSFPSNSNFPKDLTFQIK